MVALKQPLRATILLRRLVGMINPPQAASATSRRRVVLGATPTRLRVATLRRLVRTLQRRLVDLATMGRGMTRRVEQGVQGCDWVCIGVSAILAQHGLLEWGRGTAWQGAAYSRGVLHVTLSWS